MHRFTAVFLTLALALSLRAQTIETPPTTAGGRILQQLVADARMDELRWPDFSDYRRHLRNFYGPAGYRFFWSENGRVTPQARAAITLFESADVKGVNAVDYDGGRWSARLADLAVSPSEAALARFDMALSITLMRYVSDLHIGRINPRNVAFDLDIETKKYYLPTLLTSIAAARDANTILNTVEPPYDEYKRLQTALAKYRLIATEAERETPLPSIAKLKPGESWAAVPQLAKMLRRFGDLASDAVADGNKYDGALVDAVKHFQKRHGLAADGVIAAKTVEQLNVPVARRVKQLQWALERWRWVPSEFDTPPILVNIPEFRLRAWDDKQHTALTMPVVVGGAYRHQTPVFAGDMKYVVFRPYWSVPPTIQRAEIVPHLEKDPGYLARNNYEVVSDSGASLGSTVDEATLRGIRSVNLRIRQKPGTSNALGLVKFVFPNNNNVYLHSTPSQALFSRARRDFSHGCIRVEDPVALAQWVLRDRPEWTAEKIKAAMNGTANDQYLTLSKTIPVLIIYATAVVEENGDVYFFDDIYGHDATLENALAAGYPYPA